MKYRTPVCGWGFAWLQAFAKGTTKIRLTCP